MANTRIIINLFFIISTFIKCDDAKPPIYSKCENNPANDKYDCFDRISEEEKSDGYHCCYRKNTISNRASYECSLLEKDDYENIDGFEEDELKYDKLENPNLEDVEIECENQSNINIFKYKYLIFILLNLIIM